VVVIADDCSSDNTLNLFLDIIPSCIISRGATQRGPLQNTLAAVRKLPNDVEIICFIDGDDVWVKDKLRRVEEEFVANDSLLILSHHHTRVDSILNKLSVIDDTHLAIQRVLASPLSERHEQLRESALARRGYWFGSAYSVRHFPRLIDEFKSIADASRYSADSYFDLAYGPFLIASRPNGHVGYIEDITFYYRIHSSGSGNGLTPLTQLASLRRLKSVNLFTRDILFSVTRNASLAKRYEDLVTELTLHELLYSYQFFKAIKFFFQNLMTLHRNGTLFKELVRTILIILLRPSFFLKIKNRFI
jgi:glycosyltransferase involved in cell wall biosynthesis